MTAPVFSFTRNPSVKVAVKTSLSGLVAADNTLIIVAKRGATGGSAVTGTLVTIDNYGDDVAAATECTTKFGATSQIQDMVVAAIKGVRYSSLEDKLYPPIKVLVLATDATSATLAAELASIINTPSPFIVTCYPASDATAAAALKAHIQAISASDRGDLGQFGSFGFSATDAVTGTATPLGEAAAYEGINIAWLRDGAVTKANKIEAVAAAYAAVCAALQIPFLPLNDVKIGGLVAPVAITDWHTPGDAGSVALGLASGLVPLKINTAGEVIISRSVSTSRVVVGVEDSAYYDHQDWRVLYYLRKNLYNLAQQPRYKRAKATVQKLQALKSEAIKVCKDLETLEMLQHVDLFADQFTVDRSLTNRHAAVYRVPVNVVPGFHNKGLEVVGSTQFDEVVA